MSNKTLKKPEEKTESAPNPTRNRASIHLLLGAGMLFLGGWLLWSGVQRVIDNKQLLVTPNGRINIEVADEAEERYQGLSGRYSVDGGLLFVYEETSTEHCLVMRDMNFAIDMVWLNEDKVVVTVEENVAPETYPEIFCPDQPAMYALELAAGKADEHGIEVDKKLVF